MGGEQSNIMKPTIFFLIFALPYFATADQRDEDQALKRAMSFNDMFTRALRSDDMFMRALRSYPDEMFMRALRSPDADMWTRALRSYGRNDMFMRSLRSPEMLMRALRSKSWSRMVKRSSDDHDQQSERSAAFNSDHQ